uniref:Uncharacterized protein MANES_13G026500 n=1 Tax=Rhizophora mucronata TaxID=61149 RepID=A0A2P2J4Z6_RHIMU
MAMPRLFGRTRAIAGRSQKKYLEQPLFEKLFEEGGSELSVRRQLNQFLKSSKHVYKWEVDFTIKKLRDRKLYYPALKVPFLNNTHFLVFWILSKYFMLLLVVGDCSLTR